MTHGQLNTEQWGPHRALPLPSSLRDPAQGSLSWKWLPTIRAGGGELGLLFRCSFGREWIPRTDL